MAIGFSASTSSNCIAIGSGARASHNNNVAIGYGATAGAPAHRYPLLVGASVRVYDPERGEWWRVGEIRSCRDDWSSYRVDFDNAPASDSDFPSTWVQPISATERLAANLDG